MHQTRSYLLFVIPLLIAIGSFSFFMLAIWYGWMGPPQGVGAGFCEASDGWIKQPANTWSNFGFITAGLVIGWMMMRGAFHKNDNAFTRSNFTPIFFASLTVLLGPGSMAMHATLTPIGGDLDMLSMYLICAFMTAYSLQRFFNWKPLHFTIVFFAVIALCEWAGTYQDYIPVIEYAGNAAFAFFIILAIIFEGLITYVRKTEIEVKWGIYGLISIISAFIIWNLWKNDSPLCDPHSLIQGHAIWHLLDAVAVFFLFKFYASEHSPKPTKI